MKPEAQILTIDSSEFDPIWDDEVNYIITDAETSVGMHLTLVRNQIIESDEPKFITSFVTNVRKLNDRDSIVSIHRNMYKLWGTDVMGYQSD